MKNIISAIVIFFLSSCTLGPDYSIPEFSFSKLWHGGESKSQEPLVEQESFNNDWWKKFSDPILNDLIERAALNNHDIRIALANVKRAKALRRESRGAFWPVLGSSVSAEKRGFSVDSNSNSSGSKERDNFGGDLDASWELDIFGGIRRDTEARDAELQSAKENRRGVLLSVLAEVARNYFEVRGLQKRIAITKHNINLLKEVEELAEAQFELGVVTEFDVARARGEREATEATIPNLEAELQAGIYRISLLTGKAPEEYLNLLKKHKSLPSPPEIISLGLRSEILRRRPDVREAERNLASATAEIGVATADLFPKFSLTSAIGTSARIFADMVKSGSVTYSLGSEITWPLFEGGALRARIAEAEAGAEEALITYEQAVFAALEESEAALARYSNEKETLKRLQALEKSREEAFDIAKLRYEGGEENFLVILDAERSLIAAQDDVVQSETRILLLMTDLYKALGGGWENFEKNEFANTGISS